MSATSRAGRMVLVALGLSAAAGLAMLAWWHGAADRRLAAKLANMVALAADAPRERCQRPGIAPPLLLLVLGQSNAGNHGAEELPPARGGPPQVSVFVDGDCTRAGDPLPGATGRHQSIWTRLPEHLNRLGYDSELVFAVLAVEATSIADWTRPSSPLRARLQALLRELQSAAMQPDLVLWQQGEADAQRGTAADEYVRGFEALLSTLRAGGVGAPVLVAQSTHCRHGDKTAVRSALQRLAEAHRDVLPGPDTDALQGEYRPSGCHFSRAGLDAAAALWAAAILRHHRGG